MAGRKMSYVQTTFFPFLLFEKKEKKSRKGFFMHVPFCRKILKWYTVKPNKNKRFFIHPLEYYFQAKYSRIF